MNRQFAQKTSPGAALGRLSRLIDRIAQRDGNHATAIPALMLTRRSTPTDPLHCTYDLGLGVVAQGAKQVLLGSEVIDYAPGQSLLTTIDLPVVAHVTQASGREPFLGLRLTLDTGHIMQVVAEMDLAARRTGGCIRG